MPALQLKQYNALVRHSRRSILSNGGGGDATKSTPKKHKSPHQSPKKSSTTTTTSTTTTNNNKSNAQPSTPTRRQPLSLSDDELGAIVGGDNDNDDDDDDDERPLRSTRSTAAPLTPLKTKAAVSKRQVGGVYTNVLMQLRKMANHPLLCRYHYTRARLERVARALLSTNADAFVDVND
jgi:hypothetical protein